MIRLTRPALAPKVLRDRGARQTVADIALVLADPAAFRSGEKTLVFRKSLYRAKSVKDALKRVVS